MSHWSAHFKYRDWNGQVIFYAHITMLFSIWFSWSYFAKTNWTIHRIYIVVRMHNPSRGWECKPPCPGTPTPVWYGSQFCSQPCTSMLVLGIIQSENLSQMVILLIPTHNCESNKRWVKCIKTKHYERFWPIQCWWASPAVQLHAPKQLPSLLLILTPVNPIHPIKATIYFKLVYFPCYLYC